MRLMAKQMSVSKSSIRTIVEKDLGFSPLKICKKTLIDSSSKKKMTRKIQENI